MATKRSGAQKPVARVKVGKVSAGIYRGRFRMAEHMRYLDINALERANKAVIDVGSVHAAGVSVPLVAEVRKGTIVKVWPSHCEGCKNEPGRKGPPLSERKRAAKAALLKIRELKLRSVRLPVRLESRGGGVGGIFGGIFGSTITIIIDYDICIVIEGDDGTICYYCILSGSFCIGPPDPGL